MPDEHDERWPKHDVRATDLKGLAFGPMLRRARTIRGLTQAQLASRAGLHRTFVGRVENGKYRAPKLSTIQRMARALELTPKQTILLILDSGRTRQPLQSELMLLPPLEGLAEIEVICTTLLSTVQALTYDLEVRLRSLLLEVQEFRVLASEF